MGIEELKARARARAAAVQVDMLEAPELLRTEAMQFFSKVPEPPVYRRRDDPAITRAQALTIEGERLLAFAYALERRGRGEQLQVWTVAIEQHLVALSLLEEGKIEAA